MLIPLGILAALRNGGVGGGDSFQLIETVDLSVGVASVTFSSIPQDFKHLQIRSVAKDDFTTNTLIQNLTINFNNDTTALYASHWMTGNGTNVQSTNSINQTRIALQEGCGTTNSGNYIPSIVDILDYSSTTKNKTTRSLHGGVGVGEKAMILASGLWRNTNAISTIVINRTAGVNFVAGSRFSLYGIQG